VKKLTLLVGVVGLAAAALAVSGVASPFNLDRVL
jgi:hypothetical protein